MSNDCQFCGEELIEIDGESLCPDCSGPDGEHATEFTHDGGSRDTEEEFTL